MTDDITLLREYARCNSEEAFAALVSRHVDLVYSVALRDVQDPYLAEEITQAVFIILARKAESFDSKVVLSGWLYRTARYTSANALSVHRRRQQREQEAYVQSLLNESESTVWTQISPLLGEAMKQLGQKDHDAVVLRFFENKSFQEIGAVFGASENAAKKRVAYALEKMRKYFSKHGVTSTVALIAGAISANSVQAAPATLAKAVTATAFAKGATASTSTLTLIKGALRLMAWSNAKTAIVAGVTVLLVVGTATTMVIQHKYASYAQTDFPRSSWSFAGYATPEDTAQSLFWAMRESNSNSFQIYLNGLVPKLQDKMQQEAQNRGSNAFAELSAQEMGGVTRYRILKKVMLSDNTAQLQIQFGGLKGPVQTIAMEKIGNEWRCAGE